MYKRIIEKEVEGIKEQVIKLRREFHMYPEIGFEEHKTSKKVEEFLRGLGLEVKGGIAKTGVVGILKGGKPGKTIALRADMDALTVKEQNQVDYKSRVEGKMHACGHDGHTAMLLGAAKILAELKDHISGNIKFIFQPAEEGPGIGGAKPMTEENVLEGVDAVFAMHLDPLMPVGKVGINSTNAMASTDIIEIILKGRGGHAGYPHKSIDAISMAARVIDSLQYIVSRSIDPMEPAVVSIGTIKGGYSSNVIADEVLMTGTIRTQSPEVRRIIPKKVEDVVKSVSSMCGGEYRFDITPGVPPVINSREESDFVRFTCVEELGEENVIHLARPSMTGEDFSFYLERVKGAFFWLGCGNEEKGIDKPLHNPMFQMDEEALAIGTRLHVALALKYLG